MKKWLDEAEDPKISTVSATVNGPLMQALAEATGYSDSACITSFISGAPILGRLPSSGRGKTRPKKDECGDRDELITGMQASNKKLLDRRKEDANSSVLLSKTKMDADAGRMSQPSPLRSVAAWMLVKRRTCIKSFVQVCSESVSPRIEVRSRTRLNSRRYGQSAPGRRPVCVWYKSR